MRNSVHELTDKTVSFFTTANYIILYTNKGVIDVDLAGDKFYTFEKEFESLSNEDFKEPLGQMNQKRMVLRKIAEAI